MTLVRSMSCRYFSWFSWFFVLNDHSLKIFIRLIKIWTKSKSLTSLQTTIEGLYNMSKSSLMSKKFFSYYTKNKVPHLIKFSKGKNRITKQKLCCQQNKHYKFLNLNYDRQVHNQITLPRFVLMFFFSSIYFFLLWIYFVYFVKNLQMIIAYYVSASTQTKVHWMYQIHKFNSEIVVTLNLVFVCIPFIFFLLFYKIIIVIINFLYNKLLYIHFIWRKMLFLFLFIHLTIYFVSLFFHSRDYKYCLENIFLFFDD